MTSDSEKLHHITDMQQSEAQLHWNRNNYFLVVSSILLLALSQFDDKFIQFAIGFLGSALSIVWLSIQYRSSQYIKYWKNLAQNLSSTSKLPDIYPKKLSGFEMRRIVYWLPICFLILWILITMVNLFSL